MSDPKLRLSIGTAMVLGLRKGSLPDPPTTAYIMVGSECINNCAFCTQARGASGGSDMLSRVIWPQYRSDAILEAIVSPAMNGMSRICLQCLVDPTTLPGLPELIRKLKEASGSEISVSISAVDDVMLKAIRDAGARRIGIALDGASREVFDRIKGSKVGNPYTWEGNWRSLLSAVDIFGRRMATTHIIVGLGETDRDIVDVLVRCSKEGVLVSLFSYTPMKGTKELGPAPQLHRYRALQIARALVMERITDGFDFDPEGKLTGLPTGGLDHRFDLEEVFRTRGCPDCNRPYYNERPGGPIYNYPRRLSKDEASASWAQAMSYIGMKRTTLPPA
ncbi:MAG: radical SAM protein [Candidatus Thermoplasmatota archaeon]|nr:radical SAM protein [Candidatus Thermoplasmatota archaeon]